MKGKQEKHIKGHSNYQEGKWSKIKEKLRGIKELNNNTMLKITCNDGEVLTGYYRGYTSGANNEPEIAQLDILTTDNKYIGLFENEIKAIVVN